MKFINPAFTPTPETAGEPWPQVSPETAHTELGEVIEAVAAVGATDGQQAA